MIACAFDLDIYQLIYSSDIIALKKSSKQYILGIYFNNNCIEYRKSEKQFTVPLIDEELYIEFKNTVYSENMELGGLLKNDDF